MKKKHVVILLLAVGIVLLLTTVILASIETGNKNIIGGADLPTFVLVFHHEKGGIYYNLASLGVCSIIASIVVGITKKKKQ